MRSYRRFFQREGLPHPGEILRDLYLEPLKITVFEAAKDLAMTEADLYVILRGKAGISPELAIKLAMMFRTTPNFWLNLQANYDAQKIVKQSGQSA